MSELLSHISVLFLLSLMEKLFFSGGLFRPMDASYLRFSAPKLHTHSHAAILHTLTTPTNQGAFNSHGSLQAFESATSLIASKLQLQVSYQIKCMGEEQLL